MNREVILDLLNKIKYWTQPITQRELGIGFCMQNINDLTKEIEVELNKE